MPIDFFLEKFQQKKNNHAIVWNENIFNYSWLENKIRQLQKDLDGYEIKNGTIVAVDSTFSPLTIALLFALIERKSIIIPLYKSNSKIKEEMLKNSECEFLLSVKDEIIECSHLKNNSKQELYKKLREKNHPGLVLFSSGSSGQQKAAVHDFNLLLEKFKVNRKLFVTLNFFLFDHWGGLNTMFHTLSNGGILVCTDNRNPENICRLIEKYKIEVLPVSPSFLNLLLISEDYKKFDLDSLKIISYGTESMSETILKKICKIFPNVKIQQTYGLIEVGVMRSKSKSSDSLWVKLGGEGYETRIRNGILEIKANSTMLGYLNAPSPFTNDGWFNTGDKVLVDGEYYKILGRDSEIINVGGEKVYPTEVENVIQEISNVSEVTVYGEKNPILGNIVCAKISLIEETNKLEFIKQVKKFCKERLQKYKIPVKINIENKKQYNYRFKKTRIQ